ncbi:MAG: cytochrome c3 family protein [Desulfuromonadales bacterium]|nr:cytochrome c3 family protein [Desulfuromonadales bacterium]
MKWRRSLLIILLFSFLFSNSFADSDLNYKFTKTYQNSAGAVTFSHEQHALVYAKDCAQCHSALKIFGGEVNELFAHNFCKQCHLDTSTGGPTDCVGCHNKNEGLSQ